MTQERIAFFEQVLAKPMAEPHRSWIAELLEAAKGSHAPTFTRPAKAKGNHAPATVPVIEQTFE